MVAMGPGREPAQRPAVRRRPPRHGRRGAAARRRGPRRPHRPELRLPGAQGDAQGRRGRAALEARAVPRHRQGDGHRGAGRRRARSRSRCASGIDADHLTYLEAGRIAPGRGRRVRWPCTRRTAAQLYARHRRLGRRSPALEASARRRRPGARATATSGRPPTPLRDGRRAPGATASSSGAAASAGRGCSAELVAAFTASEAPARSPTCARSRQMMRPARRAARRAVRRGHGSTRLPQAPRRGTPRVSGSAPRPVGRSASSTLSPMSMRSWRRWTSTRAIRRVRQRTRAVARPPPAGSRCPSDGWTTATGSTGSWPSSWTPSFSVSGG